MTLNVQDRLGLLDAVIYGDVFDCAVTFDELWRFARTPIERGDLRARLAEDTALREAVAVRGDLVALGDRAELIKRRPDRARRAAALERRARKLARVLRHAPFVRGLALTGSAAVGDAKAGDDVDFLVVVAPRRLATAFLVLGPLARLVRRRLGCPNYYVSADFLAIEPRSVYIARELAQARLLVGDADLLRDSNPWIRETFPNLAADVDSTLSAGKRIQRLLERPLRGALGDRFESWARGVASERLQVHYRGLGQTVPVEVAEGFRRGKALRFHGGGVAERTSERYAARRAEVSARLEQQAERVAPDRVAR